MWENNPVGNEKKKAKNKKKKKTKLFLKSNSKKEKYNNTDWNSCRVLTCHRGKNNQPNGMFENDDKVLYPFSTYYDDKLGRDPARHVPINMATETPTVLLNEKLLSQTHRNWQGADYSLTPRRSSFTALLSCIRPPRSSFIYIGAWRAQQHDRWWEKFFDWQDVVV